MSLLVHGKSRLLLTPRCRGLKVFKVFKEQTEQTEALVLTAQTVLKELRLKRLAELKAAKQEDGTPAPSAKDAQLQEVAKIFDHSPPAAGARHYQVDAELDEDSKKLTALAQSKLKSLQAEQLPMPGKPETAEQVVETLVPSLEPFAKDQGRQQA